MKVMLFNGSPKEKGCTYTALCEIAKTLQEEGIESQIFHVGNDPIGSCKGCQACAKLGKCIFDDKVNDFVELMRNCDALVIGSPVHYAAATGATTAFLDRAFYSSARSPQGSAFERKAGFAIASARRAGTTTTLDQLNKYFLITQMPIISGRYWNMVHGNTPDEVVQDLEGMQNLRVLARNMAWYLKCNELALKSGLTPPQKEEVVRTNFIR